MTKKGILIRSSDYLHDPYFDKLDSKERTGEYLTYMNAQKSKFLGQILAMEAQIELMANALKNKTISAEEYFDFLEQMEIPLKSYAFCLIGMAEVKYDIQAVLRENDK